MTSFSLDKDPVSCTISCNLVILLGRAYSQNQMVVQKTLTKLSDKGIFDSFLVLILRLKYINSTIVFIPNYTEINMQGCVAK